MVSELIWEDLQLGGLQILQNKKGYKFTSDAVILANFVNAKGQNVVEFCFGSGIISTLIAHKENPNKIWGFEIQENVYNQALLSIEKNNLANIITLFNQDNKNAKEILKDEKIDVVVVNPPYKKLESGKLPFEEEIAISKAEVKTNLTEIVESAKALLSTNGKLYICLNPERLDELILVLEKNKFAVKEMFFSYPNTFSQASCVFVMAKKDAKQGMKVLPPLITHNDKGDYVAIIKELFK